MVVRQCESAYEYLDKVYDKTLQDIAHTETVVLALDPEYVQLVFCLEWKKRVNKKKIILTNI